LANGDSSKEIRETVRFGVPHITWSKNLENSFKLAVDSGWVSVGDNVTRLEEHCRRLFNIEHVVACSSATQGLSIALRAAGWDGLRVGLPSFTWPSTLYAVQTNNCIPVFADINPETWLVDFSTLGGPIDALLPVDIFGNQWLSTAAPNVPIIVDAAHGFGLPNLGKRGLFEIMSLSHTKVPTAGEGGLILTTDANLAEKARTLRHLVSRMPEFNAILALDSMKAYADLVVFRSNVIKQYIEGLEIDFVVQKENGVTNHSVFAIRLPDVSLRNAIFHKLKNNGFESKIYYEPLYRGLFETERLFDEILCLPIYPKIKKHIPTIIQLINESA
jgi:dTDP-4-amino-4,6-dideoxygalactose transaminase